MMGIPRAQVDSPEVKELSVAAVGPAVRQRARRPTDVVRFVASILVFTLVSAVTRRGSVDLGDWQGFVEDLPPWVVRGCVALVVVTLAVAVLVAVSSLFRLRSDVTFVRDVLVALLLSAVAAAMTSSLVTDDGIASGLLSASRTSLLVIPDLVMTAIAAVVVSASAHVARPNRRALWWMLLFATWCAILTDPFALLPVLAGVALSLAVGSGWLALVGSPAGLPDPAVLAASLNGHGIPVSGVTMLGSTTWGGAAVCTATDLRDGSSFRIKVYGRDAATADFWTRQVRRVTYLDAQRTGSGKGIDSVEHEAAVTAFAAQNGAPVTQVAAVSDWAEPDPFIAVQWPGTGLDQIPAEAISGIVLASTWDAVKALHRVGVIHGGLDGASLRVEGSKVILANLDRARFSTTQRLRDRDLAGALVVIASRLGPQRAVESAVQCLGVEDVNNLVSYLEPAAIRVPLGLGRDGLKQLLGALKDEITTSTGLTPPPPAELKRLTARRLLAMGLVVLAVTALGSALSGIDFAAVAQEVYDADWIFVVLALVVGQLILIPEALATTSLVPERLPFGPLVALQSAMRFLGLAVPGPAARVAANVAFLRKQGIVVSRSLTLGVLDSTAGLLVELIILVIAVLVGDLSLALFGIEPLDLDWALITVLLLIALGVVALLLRFVQPLRERALGIWRSVQDALSVLRQSPSRALALVAANFAARVVSACALWLVLVALGVDLDFIAVLVVIAASNLLSGLIPVPGNVGVAEAALTAFLVAAGVPQDTAFAAAVVYRMVTAYIPPFWGAAAQRWLARNDYL